MHYLEELLAERHLAKKHFGRLVGFTSGITVNDYIRGKRILPESVVKIERGIRVLESYDAVCPELGYGRNYASMVKRTWGDLNQNYLRYTVATAEYDAGFRELWEAID